MKPHLRIGWIMLLWYVVSGKPPECSKNIEATSSTLTIGQRLSVTCGLRTLSARNFESTDNNETTATFSNSEFTTSLSLICARQVVFESSISPAMFSSFFRLEELYLVNCKILKIVPGTMQGLSRLKKLAINSHHEEWPGRSLEIEPNALSDLPRIEILDLAYNALWTLPPGFICQFPSLLIFNLTYNSIHQITDLQLDSTERCSYPILKLMIDNNEISEIPDNALLSANNLRHLSLSNNQIGKLSDSSFYGLFNLRFLDLSANNLYALPINTFTNLKNLKELNLSNNTLTTILPNAFNLSQLQSLNLSHNIIDFVENANVFHGLIRLVILDLSYNQISYLPRNLFVDLYTLQILNLSQNNIQVLTSKIFLGLSNVHTLELSENIIENISSEVFSGMSVLTYLNLNHNKIDHVDEYAFRGSSLQRINLCCNNINKLPRAVNNITLLKEIDLSHNNIKSIKTNAFFGLSHIVDIKLHHNNIVKISPNSFRSLSQLISLDISFNEIKELGNNTLTKLNKLEELNISHNHFKSLYGFIGLLHHLKFLNASANKLEWFDYAVLPQGLSKIDISDNKIDALGNHYKLDNQLNLKVLYADKNNLTLLNSLSIINSLEELYLRCNFIDLISPNTFIDKENLSIINLENNSLSILGEPSIRVHSKRTQSNLKIYLSGNPLECNCESEWLLRADGSSMREYVSSSLPVLGEKSNLKCNLPGIWGNKLVPVMSVRQDQFLCTYRRHCFSVCHCCDFDACDCEQTCPKNCSCYHDHTWSHNIVDCGNSGWRKVPSGIPMDVTEAYIDGNEIGALTSHALIGKKNLKSLHLNNSKISSIQNQTFNGLKNLLILRLEHNVLEVLHGYEFAVLHKLVELSLSFNRLNHISNNTFAHLRSLEKLDLDNNRLASFSIWSLTLNPFLIEVSLHENPWSCECKYITSMRKWLEANRIKTINASKTYCVHNSSKERGPPLLSGSQSTCDHYITTNALGAIIVNDYIMLMMVSIVVLVIIVSGILIIVAYRRRLKHWALSRYGKQLFDHPYVEDREKLFDVFISHSAKDTAWVCGLLAPELEARGYTACVAHRDCVVHAGSLTSQAVSESMTCSRRVIIVISKGFVDCDWCRYEFKSAHINGLRNIKSKHRIIVKLDNIANSEYDSELATIVKNCKTVLQSRNTKFWERLVKLLPEINRSRNNLCNGVKNTNSRCKTLSDAPSEIKYLIHNQSHSYGDANSHTLTMNPCWDSAMSETLWNNHKMKTWDNHNQNIELQQAINNSKNDEHTYMSMSDCDDVTHSGDTSSSVLNTQKISKSPTHPSKPIKSQSYNLPPYNSPDYVTKSWIFHKDQNSDQTYFV